MCLTIAQYMLNPSSLVEMTCMDLLEEEPTKLWIQNLIVYFARIEKSDFCDLLFVSVTGHCICQEDS